MPRRSRKKSKTGIYHVMARGIDRSVIFHDDEDNEKFLSILQDCIHFEASVPSVACASAGDSPSVPPDGCDRWTVPSYVSGNLEKAQNVSYEMTEKPAANGSIYVYCLMSNHFHLLIQENNESIDKIMKRIEVRYASYYNWKYKRTGHLFQDRFRSEPVEDERYFLAVYRYIVLNPVKASLVQSAGAYRWCNFQKVENGQRFSLSGNCKSIASLPLDLSEEQIIDFVISDQPNIQPFHERITDRMAEELLLSITGLKQASDFRNLGKNLIKNYLSILQEENLSILQISRLTGLPKSNIFRYLQ